MAQQPARVPGDPLAERRLVERPRRAHRREDAAARRVQLLVARTRRPQRELLDAVAAERRMRVAVDETRNRAQAAPVELLDVAVASAGRSRIRPTASITAAVAEDERVLDHVDAAERGTAQRRGAVPRASRAARAP